MKLQINVTLFFLFLLFSVSCNKSVTDNEIAIENIDNVDTSIIYILAEDLKTFDDVNNYAVSQWYAGNFKEALVHYTTAYKLAKTENDDDQTAAIMVNLGLFYWRFGKNETAMEYYAEAEILAEKIDNKRILGLIYTNQGLVLRREHQYAQALSKSNASIKLLSELGISRDLAIAYNNHGQIFKVQNQMDSAQYYYNKALDIYLTIDYSTDLAATYGSLSEVDASKGLEQNAYSDGMAATYSNLSEVYAYKGLEQNAFEAAHKALEMGMKAESKTRTEDAYKLLSATYEKFGKIDSALHYHKIFSDMHIKNILFTYSQELAEYETEMRTEIKKLRIENLEKEKTLAHNRMLLIIIIFVFILLVVLFTVYRIWHSSKIKKRLLETELQTSNEILQIKELELKSYIIDLSKKNRTINELQIKLSEKIDNENITTNMAQLLNLKILTDEDWKVYKEKFTVVYPGFFAKIKQLDVHISEAETRFLVLLKLGLPGKEIANMLAISPQSVRALKMRMKKKLMLKGYCSVEKLITELKS